MPSENYVLLERTELNASAASVTFANIPQTGYTDLKIVVCARSSSTSGYAETVNMKFNNSATSDYSWRGLYSVTATPGSNNSSSVAQIRAGNVPSANLTANTFSNNEIYIPNYTSANFKSVSIDAVSEVNGSTDFTYTLMLQAALRSNTAAITSIDLSLDTGGTSFVAGSTFSLYGIAAVGTTPLIAPKASGGNIIDYDGTYWIHTFTSSGTFTPQTGLTCDYLVVAGGGGGGGHNAGGGGAGGLRSTVTATGGGGSLESAITVATNTAYAITVGAGGAGGNDARGSSGANSVFSTITSTGGGGGAGNSGGQGATTGGSGGGGHPGAGANGTTNQGRAGGSGFGDPSYAGGGGGGASAVGVNATSGGGGNGGAGVAVSITGTSVTYAGGGGGSTFNGTQGSGGTGGGGTATFNTAPTAATANLGGGGGAINRTTAAGGNGGSGVVIIRYPAA